ncbi:hypothetical protein J7E79_17815 [Bacillus sp. ISL-40]|uniref:hypothetical protein n=1 Tax=unclassified Bacillus (in: firmicutes) TaxID=185979 RepID=UPI001BE53BC1|nr:MULTISPECIES: hypothetical protein [unclassified Bacillus (in: firmicutes)]MBT2699243.1 hypothetical protein [Bacillus sp. ISL-40]MBT2723489.1 hypothetical protein [Bacillus sp. ISL-46]MBT2739897.1 hypothetical protein [Bacillus sp. ISL-77]
MRVYETILSILEEKGPLPIPAICNEVNQVLVTNREKPILPAHIRSIVKRKRDLFRVNGGRISIHPEKYPVSLIASLEGFGGISYQVRVHFVKNRFAALIWRNKENYQPFSDFQADVPGDLEEFKRELYSLNIWEWKPTYRSEDGIIIEGKYWSIKLITKGKVYESEGTESFPGNWNKFCHAVENLTGTPFH